MLKQTLTTEVLSPLDETVVLAVVYENDVLEFFLEGNLVFSADWSRNLMRLFIRALQLWFEWDRLDEGYNLE